MATPRREEKKAREQAARRARLAAQRRRRQQKSVAVIVSLALVVGSLGLLGVVNSGDDSDSPSSTSTTLASAIPKADPVPAGAAITGDTPCPAADGSAARASSFAKAPPMCIDASKNYKATFDTTEGVIEVALDAKATPSTTNNFVVLSRYHYYDGSAIFRTDPGIDIVQGGNPGTQDNTGDAPGYTIQDEGTPFTYAEGDLVMANTGQPNSSGAQYFFGTGPNVSGLNGPPTATNPSAGSYLKFGKVSSGMDVLKKIMALHVTEGDSGGPSKIVLVNKVTITES